MKTLTPDLQKKFSDEVLNRRASFRSLGGIAAAGVLCGINTSVYSTTSANSTRTTGLPAELDEFAPQIAWRKRGTATLRVLLFKVYDATLWSSAEKANPLEEAAPFALDITYALAVKRDDLVDTSMQEMTRLRNPNAATLSRWNASLKSVFPSVASGDRLLGVSIPGKGARFYHNGKLTGEVTDSAFSEAFFAIWLDGNTKKPDVRRALLGA
jgi:Chalcone isomerase-like